jgi:outer membrane autotransporter protein
LGANQRSVATVLDSAKPAGGSDLDRTIVGLLNQNSDGLVRTALDSFGLESVSAHRETALAGTRRLVGLALRRGADRRGGQCGRDEDNAKPVAAGACVFLQGFTGSNDTDGRAGLAGADGDIDGLATGFDLALGDNAILGASLGTSKTVSRNRGGRVEEKSVTAGVHAAFSHGDFHVDAAINFAWGNLESTRQIRLPAAPFSARAKADTRSAAYGIEAGYDLRYGGLRFTPFAGLIHAQLDEDGFNEGSAAGVGLGVDGIQLKSTRLYGGLSIEPAHSSAIIQPFFRANVSTEAGQRLRAATGRFTAVPEAGRFTTRTVRADRSIVEISGGLRARIGERVSLTADYSGSFGKSTEGHNIRGGLAIAF